MTAGPFAFIDVLNPVVMVALGVIAVLLFGEQLPEAARSFGQKFMEFKKSIQSVQDELRSAAYSATSAISSGVTADSSSGSGTGGTSDSRTYDDSDRDVATAPKFVPPPSEPQVEPVDL